MDESLTYELKLALEMESEMKNETPEKMNT
jgi:hypothetical protein